MGARAERQNDQINWVERFGGDIKVVSGMFARDLVARLDLRNPNVPRFSEQQKQNIAENVFISKSEQLQGTSPQFREGFAIVQRFADGDLKLLYHDYPSLPRVNENVDIGPLKLEKFDLYMNLCLDTSGISVMRNIYSELNRVGKIYSDPRRIGGVQCAVEMYEEAARANINYCLAEIMRVKRQA